MVRVKKKSIINHNKSMSSLWCWMQHDRQGCLSKEIILHFEFNSCWWNSSKFHRRLFAILLHWCPAPAEWFLPPSTPGATTFVTAHCIKWHNDSWDKPQFSHHECFGCPISLSLSPSIPDNLQIFCFYKSNDVPKFPNKSSHCIGSMVGQAHSCSSLWTWEARCGCTQQLHCLL